MSTVTLRVEGMTCGSCPVAVRTAPRKLDGVRDAPVSRDENTVAVPYDPAGVAPEAMVAAISSVGFTAGEAP